jgi:hypothetical protein
MPVFVTIEDSAIVTYWDIKEAILQYEARKVYNGQGLQNRSFAGTSDSM